MEHLTYLSTTLVFCGIPWLIMLKYQERVLKRYEIVLLVVVLIGFLFSTSDYFGTRWGAWYYNPTRTLGIHFLTGVETFILGAGVALEVGSATIIWASYVDRKIHKHSANTNRARNKTKRKHRKIPIKAYSK